MTFPRRISTLGLAFAVALVLAACASSETSTASDSFEQVSDIAREPASDPVYDDDHDEDWYEYEDETEIEDEDEDELGIVDDDVAEGHVSSPPPRVERPTDVEVISPESADLPADLGVVFVAGFDGVNRLGTEAQRHWLLNDADEPLQVTSVDGDGAGGLVIVADSTMWWEPLEGELTQLFVVDESVSLRVADVDDSSLGPLALALWDDGGIQHLSGIPLNDPDAVVFDIIVSNESWTTHHAALIGNDTDQILLSGSANGCLSLSAITFSGDPTPVQWVPLSSDAAVDPSIQPDVCATAGVPTMAASWAADGSVVIVEAGSPAQITAFDTVTGTKAWLAPTPSGPWGQSVSIDIDVVNGQTLAVVSGESSADPSYVLDVASLFTDAPQIALTHPAGTAENPASIRLAPAFAAESVRSDPFLIEDAPEPIEPD